MAVGNQKKLLYNYLLKSVIFSYDYLPLSMRPDTWYKLLNRVSGVNSGALYVQESGNMTGNTDVFKPENHTWESYTNFLLKSLPLKMDKTI